MKTLFLDQADAMVDLRDAIRQGHRRILVNCPTAWGKTIWAAEIIRRLRMNGKLVWFCVDALSLINQTIRKFHEQGIEGLAVVQANHEMTNSTKPVQVCSVATLRKRRYLPDKPYMLFVDEAHCLDEWLLNLLAREDWQDVVVVGLSASPGTRGLGLHYHHMITPVTMREMVDQGRLAAGRVFVPEYASKLAPQLAKVRLKNDPMWGRDYDTKQTSEIMQDDGIVGSIIGYYRERLLDRPTIMFAVDRAHARKQWEAFAADGLKWAYIDAFTKVEGVDGREELQKRVEGRDLCGVISVGTMIKGVDWVLSGMIDGQPTKSRMRHTQKHGRIRRLDGYGVSLCNDHAGNVVRLGLPEDIIYDELCTKCPGDKSETTAKEAPKPSECPSCGVVKPPKTRECPDCKFTPTVESKIEERPGRLLEAVSKQDAFPLVERQSWLNSFNQIAEAKGYKPGWASEKYREKWGNYPEQMLNRSAKEKPTEAVTRWLQSQNIRRAKAKQRSAA